MDQLFFTNKKCLQLLDWFVSNVIGMKQGHGAPFPYMGPL